jgi:ketosteroid isomerase-like protein
MRRAALSTLALLAACSKEPPPSPDLAVNQRAIWETIKAYHEASDKLDVDKQLTFWDPTGTLIKKHDEVVKGVEEIGPVLRDRAKAAEGQSWKTLVGHETIHVFGDMAYVYYLASVSQQTGTITAIFRRSQGKWLITHFHDTWSGTSSKK